MIKNTMSITGQIESGFRKYYQDIVADIADRMAKQDAATEKDYQEEQIGDLREACDVEESVIEELLNNRQPVTANNLLAANMLMNKPGYLFKQLDEFTKPADKDKVKNAMSHLQESMTDKESTQEAYGEMQEVFEDILEEAQYDDEIRYIDLKAIQSCRKQLTLAGNLAQEENYQIPVEINGERASIHLKVLHGAEGGKVKAAFSTESDGDIAAEFSIRNGKMSGYIACSTKEGTSRIQDKEDTLRAEFARNVESLARNEVELGSIGVIHSKELDLNSFAQEGSSNGTSVQTADLYQIAKVFITAITA